MRKFLLFLFSLIAVSAFSQQEQTPTGQDVLYTREKHGGFILHTNGMGLFYRDGKHLTAKLTRVYEGEFVSIKHPKETKTYPLGETANGFVFGKLNSFGLAKFGYGFLRQITGKEGARGVEVRLHTIGGFTLGLLKPMYVEVLVPLSEDRRQVRFDPEEHQLSEIYGKAAWAKGLTETRPFPGAYFKTGLSFEYAGNFDTQKIIETGVMVDAFYKTVPLMAFSKNYQVFTNVYLAVAIGRREF